MEFIFSCSHSISHSFAALTRSISMWTDSKINSISPSVHVLCCLLYKHTNNNLFDDSPKISDHFWKISQNCSEGLVNVCEHFPNISWRLPKVAEGFWGGTDDVSIIQHHLWVLLTRLCNYSNGNLKTCDNNLIFLHVKITYFYMWKYRRFHLSVDMWQKNMF